MVYRFIVLSDETEEFRRDIVIDGEASFFALNNAILESVGFTKSEITSFFLCNENWEKDTEVTLVEKNTSSDIDCFVMDSTRLDELIDEEDQRLLFVFEELTERAFMVELKEITYDDPPFDPLCVRSEGVPPKQFTDFEDFDTQSVVENAKAGIFAEDDNFDDGYNDEDFNDLNESDPWS
ncbi:MAG: hypothetical protein LBS54_02270 [Dysgonamonadaceae bacterium]|jgi:hypothetical protein|nr:hypothetical protein [Dysgonamonadaceae bacterium]